MNEKFSGGKEQYIMFDLEILHPDIWYWKNVISYPDELIDFVNKIDEEPLSHKAITPWHPWVASNDPSQIYGYEKDIYIETVKAGSGNEKVDLRTLYIANSMEMAYRMCYDRYMDARPHLDKNAHILRLDNVQIKKWNVGHNMGPHTDGYDGDTDLVFSLVCYLNEDYEGGEIVFPNQNITVKPKKGSLIMFPSQEPFVHQVNEVKAGYRYMSTAAAWRA